VIRQLSPMGTSKRDFTQIRLIIDVIDLAHLNVLKTEIRKLDDVIEVRRSID